MMSKKGQTYNKLVRDKMPELLTSWGKDFEQRVASDDEYRSELIKKLVEEAQEFAEAGEPEELADVLEVIEALRALDEYKDVENLRIKKKEERGGFEKKIIAKGTID